MRKFKNALMRAAEMAEADGTVPRGTADQIRRPGFIRLWMVRRRCEKAAVAMGYVTAGANVEEIDWDGLLDFLRELLPLILEFIQALLILF